MSSKAKRIFGHMAAVVVVLAAAMSPRRQRRQPRSIALQQST